MTRRPRRFSRRPSPTVTISFTRPGGSIKKERVSVAFLGKAPMTEANAFQDLIRRVRAGDPEAATALVRRYEPAIRRIVRLRLRDRRLRRSFDSLDICQSVLHSFFARAALGQFDLHRPE